MGAPPGYVGYEEGGQLTEQVRRHPYSVVLFDEIEKAHPDVFNVLLQILEDGRLTDGKGRTVDFRNTVLVMTSNVGSTAIFELANKDPERARKQAMEALRAAFRPEFINRIDEIVIFNPLGKEQLARIVNLLLKNVENSSLRLRWNCCSAKGTTLLTARVHCGAPFSASSRIRWPCASWKARSCRVTTLRWIATAIPRS
jgi:ATP-dependent Clp protease ATP-binding subunit ClpB